MQRIGLLLTFVAGLACGCAKEEPKSDGGIQIDAPGVNIKIDDDGTKIKTPGADVEVKP